MAIIQTAERSSQSDPSENVIFQRHLIAYKEAAKLIEGTVLELGSGEGYGIKELAPYAEKYIAADKYITKISDEIQDTDKVQFVQLEFRFHFFHFLKFLNFQISDLFFLLEFVVVFLIHLILNFAYFFFHLIR